MAKNGNSNTGRLRAGVASVDITPTSSIAMQGYGLRNSEGVSDPLFASALAVGSKELEWVLLCVDVIGMDRSLTHRIRQSLSEQLSLPASAITIVCSHTHSGPAVLPRLGPVDADDSYLQFLREKLVAVAQTAAKDLTTARWRFGMTSSLENINRREWQHGKVVLGVDPSGPVDNRLRVVRIDRADATSDSVPLAIIVHYACHPTISAGEPRISADWPGMMRKRIQETYMGSVVCFLQGCAGDITHRIGRDQATWPQHFGQKTSVQALVMGQLIASAAIEASQYATEFSAEEVHTSVQSFDLPFHDADGREQVELQVVRIGPSALERDAATESTWLIGLPGEPFSTYGTDLGGLFHRRLGAAEDRVLACGYTNDCVGYFCTKDALRLGGYEADSAHEIYHRPAAFSADTEEIILQRSLEAADALLLDTVDSEPSASTRG